MSDERAPSSISNDILFWFAERGLTPLPEDATSKISIEYGCVNVEDFKLLEKEMFLDIFASQKFIQRRRAEVVWDMLNEKPLNRRKLSQGKKRRRNGSRRKRAEEGAAATAGDDEQNRPRSPPRKKKKMYSDYVGVTYNKTTRKYQSCITHQRAQHYLGRYDLAVDAAAAYDDGARELKHSDWKVNFGTTEEYELAKGEELKNFQVARKATAATEAAAASNELEAQAAAFANHLQRHWEGEDASSSDGSD